MCVCVWPRGRVKAATGFSPNTAAVAFDGKTPSMPFVFEAVTPVEVCGGEDERCIVSGMEWH